MKKLLFRLPLLLLVAIVSCTDDPPTHVDKAPAIYGTVVDVQGNPVIGAKVKVIFEIPQEINGSNTGSDNERFFSEPNPFDWMANLRFHVNKPDNATLELLRYPDTSSAMTTLFKNDMLNAGTYSVTFNTKNPADTNETWPNGFYLARLKLGDSVFTHKMFHQSSMISSGTWVTTDAQGKFILDYKYFPQPGETIPRIFEQGQMGGNIVLNDSATVYIVKPNFGFTVQEMKINKTLIVEKTFTIK